MLTNGKWCRSLHDCKRCHTADANSDLFFQTASMKLKQRKVEMWGQVGEPLLCSHWAMGSASTKTITHEYKKELADISCTRTCYGAFKSQKSGFLILLGFPSKLVLTFPIWWQHWRMIQRTMSPSWHRNRKIAELPTKWPLSLSQMSTPGKKAHLWVKTRIDTRRRSKTMMWNPCCGHQSNN